MKIRLHGTTNWISDLAGDTLVDMAPGISTWTRSFAIPRYLASGAYDVLFELGTPDLTGYHDNTVVNNALQITNPAVIANVGVPILMYHNINPRRRAATGSRFATSPARWTYLQSNGWTAITAATIYNYIYKGTALPAKPVWLTFDDSYQNIYDYAIGDHAGARPEGQHLHRHPVHGPDE